LDAGWASEPISTLWSRDKYIAPAGNRTLAIHPVARHYTDRASIIWRLMYVGHLVQWELVRETAVLRVNWTWCHFVHHRSNMIWPEIELSQPRWEAWDFQPELWHGVWFYWLTYGAEPSLRSCRLCSHSRTSQSFMEPEGSSTHPYPEPDRSNPYYPILYL
jgi:hypothetical protein